MISAVNHITFSVEDLDSAFEFYTSVLGLKPLAKRRGKSAYLLAGEQWIALVQAKSPASSGISYAHLAFSVSSEDFYRMSERIRQAGAQVWQENSSPGETFYFLDPSGNKLEIHVGSWQSRVRWLQENPSSEVELFV
jgi:catechol-2,3-dioxygenase